MTKKGKGSILALSQRVNRFHICTSSNGFTRPSLKVLDKIEPSLVKPLDYHELRNTSQTDLPVPYMITSVNA